MPSTPAEIAAEQAAHAAKVAEEEAAAEREAAAAARAGEQLGDAGWKSLHEERQSRKEADRVAAAAEKRAKAAEARLAEIEAEGQSESEKALAEAAAAAADKATADTTALFAARILKAEVLAAAAGRFSNPADAVALLDLSEFDVDAEPADLRATLKSAMDELLKERPYLRAGKVEGEGDGGAKPKALTDDNMTPTERLHRAYDKSSK